MYLLNSLHTEYLWKPELTRFKFDSKQKSNPKNKLQICGTQKSSSIQLKNRVHNNCYSCRNLQTWQIKLTINKTYSTKMNIEFLIQIA